MRYYSTQGFFEYNSKINNYFNLSRRRNTKYINQFHDKLMLFQYPEVNKFDFRESLLCLKNLKEYYTCKLTNWLYVASMLTKKAAIINQSLPSTIKLQLCDISK